MDPLAETTELYEAVLRGSYEVPAQGAGTDDGRGRAAGRRWSDARTTSPSLVAVRRRSSVDGRVVLVEGEPGIGKTRLAVELLTRAAVASSARVLARTRLRGRGRARRTRPVVEVLRGRLREGSEWLAGVNDGSLARGRPSGPRAPRSDDRSAPAPEIPPAGRRDPLPVRSLGRRSSRRRRAARCPVPSFVDDAQWADDATLGLLTYGLRRLAGRRLLVVLTWRTPHEHPLRHAVLSAVHEGRGVAVQLRRLDLEAVGALVRAASRGCRSPRRRTTTLGALGGRPTAPRRVSAHLGLGGSRVAARPGCVSSCAADSTR